MTTIITRRALIAWGQTPAPELASVVSERPGQYRMVTWAEVMTQRREQQHELLARKRGGRPVHVYRLWVAFFDTTFFGGWHACLDTYTGERVWIDKKRDWLRPTLMTVYPLVLTLGNPSSRYWPAWEQWKLLFARQYTRRRQDRKPVGVTYVWWDGSKNVRHITDRRCLAWIPRLPQENV